MGAAFNYISEFEDYDDSIVITTPVMIDFVERGWLGDITYWADKGFNIKNDETSDFTSEGIHVKDVLCVRVGVKSEHGCPVEWTYMFLKY